MAKDQILPTGDSTDSHEKEHDHSVWDYARAAAFGPAKDLDLSKIKFDLHTGHGAALGGTAEMFSGHGRTNGKVNTDYTSLALGTTLTAAGLFGVLRVQNPVVKVVGAAAVMAGLAIDGMSLKSST